ncbi:cellulase family glycosylhydrolase [Solihabitans fulvus]|uniref:cellulase family glycosylhydrolase n=1 Tax=Solihabitans fulvus TaxID=1892852 RepID=UPI0016621BFB|nr:cellulase family glycosylhydrolase [Solihabitans fulvus]
MRSRPVRAVLVAAAALLAGLAVGPAQAAPQPAGGPPVTWTGDFKGVNWSDGRADSNYETGRLVLSGFGGSEDYATVKATSTRILNAFHDTLGANTVRLPVNPATVNDPWWNTYKGTIDAATDLGMKVVLGYWEETPGGHHKGVVVNPANYVAMWNRVVQDYTNQPLVNFEPMNEPFGYADGVAKPPTCNTTINDDSVLGDPRLCWTDVAARWLKVHPSINVNRVVISGTGYNTNVKFVAADPRLAGTLLSYHVYDFFPGCGVTNPQAPNPTEVRQVYDHCTHTMSNEIGSDAEKRTIVDEFGEFMYGVNANGIPQKDGNGNWLPGPNYDVPGDLGTNPVGNPCSPDFHVNSFQAVTNYIHDKQLGAIYWPGLWQDSTGFPNGYAIAVTGKSTVDGSVVEQVNDQSGLDRLRYAWNLGNPVPLRSGVC